MIKNYLKTTLRSISRNKGFTLINVLGLITGISFGCMLYVYVSHELSYDAFHEKAERIYRVITVDQRNPENVTRYGVTVPPVGPELVSNYPEVEDMVRMHRFVGQVVFEIGGENFQERNWYTADPNFFEIFDFEFISGTRSTALKDPYSLVLTESMARKYFGDRDPLGQVVKTASFGPVTITGVIRNPPENSHLKFDLLFSRVAADDRWNQYLNSWDDFGAFTYVVLDEGKSVESLRAKISGLVNEKFARYEGGIGLEFQAIRDIYLRSENITEGTESSHGQMSYIYIFSSLAIFILLIASFNYINLATAKAIVRSREVGVRKVVGAKQRQLIAQFLTESFLITFIAAAISMLVMDLVFPYFNTITGKTFDINSATVMEYVPPLAAIALMIGIVSGTYPAFYLARLKPVSSLRGKEVYGSGTVGLRKVLVVFQFTVTIVMIVSTLVIGLQMKFVQTKDIGFDKSRLMVIDINSGEVRSQFRTIKNEYAGVPGVEAVAVSTRVPGDWKNIAEVYVTNTSSTASMADSLKTYFMGFDEDMLKTYKLYLKSGRYFSTGGDADSTNILLNESAVKTLGLAEPVGASLNIRASGGEMKATVIGVIKDFNFQSLHQKVEPIIIGAWNNPFQYIDYFTVRISGKDASVIEAISRVHAKFDQRTPIEYHFLDEQLELFYAAEKRAGMIFRMAGVLSIFVGCLGLFGLATHNIHRRTKELGIRKVLGASGASLFLLLSSSFLKQVGAAFLIATPIAWYVMTEWLKAFEYRITLHAGIFIGAGIAAVMIAVATVAYRTFMAVRVNPVDSLRQE